MRTIPRRTLLAILMIMILLSLSACSSAKPAPTQSQREYTYPVTKVSGDIDWAGIPVIPIDKVLWTPDYGIRAQGQLCCDDNYLYVHQSAVEKDIRAENTEPLTPVYEDSCLEFFFMIDGDKNYFNFETNPNGVLNIQYGPEKTDRISIVREDAADYFDIHTDRTADGWEVYYRIPLAFIQLFDNDYEFKGTMTGNMYKCGNKTVNKHYLSWTQIDIDAPNFHRPDFFGTISFE